MRSDFVAAMTRDLYPWFYDPYDQFEYEYTKIWKVEGCKAAWQQATSAIGMGKLVEKKENDQINFRRPSEGHTSYAKMVLFSDGITFTKEEVDDHQKVADIVKSTAADWADGVRWAKEDFYRKFFDYGGYDAGNAVFNGTITGNITDPKGDMCYDGESFFNESDDVATRLSAAETGYYNGHQLDLSATNFETVWNHMTGTNNRNERDEVIRIMPDVLVVPPQLEFSARRLLKSTNIPGSQNNDMNALENIVDLVVLHYLTDTDAWFLGCRGKGLKAFNRQEPELRFYRDEETLGYKATINCRFGGKVDQWRFWSGSNFASS